jgi:hypothetical protein
VNLTESGCTDLVFNIPLIWGSRTRRFGRERVNSIHFSAIRGKEEDTPIRKVQTR